MSTQSYIRLVIFYNKLIVILLKVSKKADISTQGMSLVNDSMQLSKGTQRYFTTSQQVEIYK